MPPMLVARFLVALVIGLVVGIAVGKSMERDAAQGKNLTMKEYIENFDNHKEEFMSGEMPMAYAVVVGALMVIATFGLYELLVFAMDKFLGLFRGHRDVRVQPGTAPPW